MVVVGCTGGIGAGKSTVAGMLAARGAIVVDADPIARRAITPAGSGYEAVLERFGGAVLSGDGATIDRAKLASIVFSDPGALRELEAIVHPLVRGEIEETLAERAATDDVVVLDVALLVGRDGKSCYRTDTILVVDAPEGMVLDRLERSRAMAPGEVRARMAAQATRESRIAVADYVIINMGTLEELSAMVDRAWTWIESLRR